ncbi:MAG: hypothetical protein CVU87_11580 [Firmicutes bacterium HGW-Firmicutes-12]|jgi:enamine deaminase RidA (YjgF/YER057c/UK114 family)|nr:MAG: hypothetical protein CVU87_11580 [Firmicutes bacterium HGW-Firmicutes-12]
MSIVEQKAKEMGISIPKPPSPVAAYVPGVKVGEFIYTSGQLPIVDGEIKYKGKVDTGISLEEAYEAAKICALNCLGVVKSMVGDLDKIEQVVKLVGFVNSSPEFTMQPKVINGASELIVMLLGDKGLHARSAVGVNSLPLDAVCEVEMIVKLKE